MAFSKKKNINQPRLRWLRLDNAAKVYPAARRRDWTNVFRVSATLKEQVDPAVALFASNCSLAICCGSKALFLFRQEKGEKKPA